MSGIEVAGLAFGVLPILVEAVKSYKDVSRKVRTLRYYSREVKSVSEQLKVHNGIFLNEVRLLLRSIEAEEEVETMLDDAADQRWIMCYSIVQETKDTIEVMRKEIGKFDILLDQKLKGESVKAAFRRLRGAIKIAFEKPRYDDCLASLRDRNGDLSALRSQIGAFQRQNIHEANTCVRHSRLPREFNSIQSASQKLHEALCGVWCCDDPTHRGHFAKLCIDARVEAEVQLDLAISCHEPNTNDYPSLMLRQPIWLYVQSMSTSKDEDKQQASWKRLPQDTAPDSPLEPLTSYAVNIMNRASANSEQSLSSRKKTKRVHFVETSLEPEALQPVSKQAAQPIPPDFDLCQTKNICKYLQQHCQKPVQSAVRRCIGYLETPKLYRHLFYFQDEGKSADIGSNGHPRELIHSIFDTMQSDPDDALAVDDQLRLAQKTAIALLQFNDTSWLSDRWRLRDMSYLGSKNSLDNAALKTLHLSSQISAPEMTDKTMAGVELTADTVSDEVRYGINNTSLFFLGVALLEIAHWKPIEEKMTPRDLNNEVFAARRLAAGRAPLGPQYQRIAEKCLQCNFGFGTKLSSKALQTAVYNDVVCELESMIEKLTV